MRIVPNPFHQQSPRGGGGGRLSRFLESAGLMSTFQKTVLYGAAIFVLMNMMLLFGVMRMPNTTESDSSNSNNNGNNKVVVEAGGNFVRKASATTSKTAEGSAAAVQCPFRQYPPRRYYGLQKMEQPDFLLGVDYVYGKLPIMVLPNKKDDQLTGGSLIDYHTQGKLCVDQSGWLEPAKNDPTKELPFADGTNPSILSLSRLEKSYPALVTKWREELGGAYIATICMTDSQCAYKDTPNEVRDYKISHDPKATVIQTELLILDDQFRTLLQTTIYLERDAPWGRRFKKAGAPSTGNGGGGYELITRALDDARLFIHLDKLWVSYRDGPSFGYEQQVLNEIHMELVSDDDNNSNNKKGKFTATMKASESAAFCCGRNMALMEHLDNPKQLQSLTWADPVTVIDVDDKRGNKGQQQQQQQQKRHRKLAEKAGGAGAKKPKKSHFHGTNAFMVYLPDKDEFLGIGHFHRPSSRDAFNPYARFGHHYTHTFFTISSRPPFRLSRLSQEFVLPSKSNILQDDDAEIIQFLSGLEVVKLGDNNKEYAVIAYGINDCEGAAIYLSMDRVNELLKPVEPGKEVVDLMGPVE